MERKGNSEIKSDILPIAWYLDAESGLMALDFERHTSASCHCKRLIYT